MFPKVPQTSLGILRVPQLPPPLEHPPLSEPYNSTTTKKNPPNSQRNKTRFWGCPRCTRQERSRGNKVGDTSVSMEVSNYQVIQSDQSDLFVHVFSRNYLDLLEKIIFSQMVFFNGVWGKTRFGIVITIHTWKIQV